MPEHERAQTPSERAARRETARQPEGAVYASGPWLSLGVVSLYFFVLTFDSGWLVYGASFTVLGGTA